MLRGEVQYNPPSRFLEEIPEELFDDGTDAVSYSEPGNVQLRKRSDFRDSDLTPIGKVSLGTQFKPQTGPMPYDFSRDRNDGSSGGRSLPRLKAVYKKPSTDDAKKPYIAKAADSGRTLASLNKGMPAPSEPDYKVGDRVRHIKYGEGTVKAMELTPKDYKVTVVFDEAGQKLMFAAFAKLVKC